MRTLWRRIRTNWNRSDTIVFSTNTIAFVVFIANCWWDSVVVCYIASLVPLAAQGWRARRDGLVRHALSFGAMVGLAWPLGEGIATETVGWWGSYIAPGPVIWHTPLYCALIGVHASAHIFYVYRRILDVGYGVAASAITVALSAFLIGIIGENLFVASGMWTYHATPLDLWHVPVSVPLAYGLGYAILPFLARRGILVQTLVFLVWMFLACLGVGLLPGVLFA